MSRNCLTSLVCSVVVACSPVARGQDKSSNQSSTPSSHQCPAIVLICPGDSMYVGVPLEMSVGVTGAGENTPLTYHWSVSAGIIVSGQNTPKLTVDPTSLEFQCLTVTLEVTGLPNECPRTASCTQKMLAIIDVFKFDEYGDLSFKDEKVRLDNIASQLKAEPNAVLRISGVDGKHSRKGTAKRRIKRAREYLLKRHRIAADRIVIGAQYLLGSPPETLALEFWIEPRPGLLDKPCK